MDVNYVKYINQGELYFGQSVGELRTNLGSCVSIVLWHRKKHLGGMCHIVLPEWNKLKNACDDRYADCAIESFIKYITQYGTEPSEYRVGVYGGGNMFPSVDMKDSERIGVQNIEKVLERLRKNGFKVTEKDIGGNVRRRLSLNMETGDVSVTDIEMQ